MKRLLIAVLALALVLGMLPVAAQDTALEAPEGTLLGTWPYVLP